MRKIVALAAAAVMLFALCASASAATTVTIWHTFTDNQQAYLEQAAADFNASQDEYEVIVEAPIGTSWEQVAEVMGRPIDWAPGLLLRGDGYSTPFYRKD